MREKLEVLLCIPPVWQDYQYPILGTPCLAGYLKSRGILVSQWDLNAAFREFLRGQIGTESVTPGAPPLPIPAPYLTRLGERWIEGMRAACERGAVLSPADGFSYRNMVTDHLSLLPGVIADEELNIYHRLYSAIGAVARVADSGARVLGISITSEDQAVAALTLARLIHRELPGIHITLGGRWATLFWKALTGTPELAHFDTLVVSEGEFAFERIVRSVLSGVEPDNIPNTVRPRAGESLPRIEFGDLAELPAPSFDGLPLATYDKPGTLTYQSSRGCYWSRCAFCEHCLEQADSYREKPLPLVLADLDGMIGTYSPNTILFTDTALRPGRMREISEGILRLGLRIRWWCFARLDRHFSPEIFRVARQAGCFCVQFGMESANPRMLRLMQKGTDPRYAEGILRDCSKAGIQVVVSALLGFPTETPEEANQTLGFLKDHSEHIDLATVNVFRLCRGIAVANTPERYEVRILETTEELLKTNLDYVPAEGITNSDATRMMLSFYAVPETGAVAAPRLEFDDVIACAPRLAGGAWAYRLHSHFGPGGRRFVDHLLDYPAGPGEPRKQALVGEGAARILSRCDGARPAIELAADSGVRSTAPADRAAGAFLELLNRGRNSGWLALERITGAAPSELMERHGWLDASGASFAGDLDSYYGNEHVARYQDRLWSGADPDRALDRQRCFARFLSQRMDGGGREVLECGSGTANLALLLAAEGARVTGVERAPGMLAVARAKLAHDSGAGTSVRLVEGDLGEFRLDQRFDLACFSLHTFSYCDALRASEILANVRRHLRPGGRLVILNFGAAPDGERGWALWKRAPATEGDGRLCVYCRAEWDAARQELATDADWILFNGDPRPKLLLRARNLREKYIAQPEMRRLLEAAGFREIGFHGDLSGQAYREGSPLMIAMGTA